MVPAIGTAKMNSLINNASLSETLKKLRLSGTLSLRQTAKLARMSPAYLSKIESGDANPTIDALTPLLDALNLDIQLIPKGLDSTSTAPPLHPHQLSLLTALREEQPLWMIFLDHMIIKGFQIDRIEGHLVFGRGTIEYCANGESTGIRLEIDGPLSFHLLQVKRWAPPIKS
jgi:transcriptional regulator with XRE-family HTH domain